MEIQASPSNTLISPEKYITRVEKMKKLYDYRISKKEEQLKSFQGCQAQLPSWCQLLETYKQIECEHTEFSQQHLGKWKKMDQQELGFLKVIVNLYCDVHEIQPLSMDIYDWDQVGAILFNRHWKVCRSKYMESKATSVIEHPWTREEDNILSKLFDHYASQNKSNKWSLIAMEMSKVCKSPYVRLGKQCRERWINKLNPQVERGPWYKEEEVQLMKAVLKNGKKWSLISRRFYGSQRTENSLKNRFHTIIKRESAKLKYQITGKNNEEILIRDIIQILEEDSLLQQQVHSHKASQLFTLSSLESLLENIDDNFQIAIIKKRKIQFI